MDWITDRLPTKADGDKDGDVVLLLGNDRSWCEANWMMVKPGQPWLAFAPPASASTSEPTPSTPTPLTRQRRIISITEVDDTAFAIADDGTAWSLSANWSNWTQLPALPKHEADRATGVVP